jgi:hypothetical protein
MLVYVLGGENSELIVLAAVALFAGLLGRLEAVYVYGDCARGPIGTEDDLEWLGWIGPGDEMRD